ncbi:SEP domain-containing protein [Mycena olivaceomarginata]|nr:SEP domain-containing protein [Mycena olivaceomarginata]
MSSHNDSDDEHDEETYFASGERSGISVQNLGRGRGGGPGVDLLRDLLRKAQEEGASSGEASAARSGFFSGGGHMLGGEGSASMYVPGAREAVEDELAIRRLTFWHDGFTIEDGPLMRYDDPANADVLAAIHVGHAPPSILNMRPGQRVDVQVSKRTEDDYVPPPAKPFSGTGNRLGAPTSAPKRTEDDYVPPPAKPFSGTGNRLGAPKSAPSARKVQPEIGWCQLVRYQVLTPAYHLKMGGATSSTPMRLILLMLTTYRTHWSFGIARARQTVA